VLCTSLHAAQADLTGERDECVVKLPEQGLLGPHSKRSNGSCCPSPPASPGEAGAGQGGRHGHHADGHHRKTVVQAVAASGTHPITLG
jgi:hypothetical protein